MDVGANIASFIEHTLLASTATDADIEAHCAEAVRHGFRGVCIHPVHLRRARRALAGSGVLLVTVVGFPLGACGGQVKAYEAAAASNAGADELDMVIDLGALKSGRDRDVLAEIQGVVEAARGKPVKAILETAALDAGEKERACRLACRAGVRFVKTSTGFAGGGATVEDVSLLRRTADANVRIKASGGIRTRAQALALLEAGACRLGTSRSIALLQEDA